MVREMNKAVKRSIRKPSVMCTLGVLRAQNSSEGGHSKRSRSGSG
jgi:hypothetical protein